MVRLALLFGVVVGLILFAQFNWTPIALTFLGIQTPPLPVSLWILAAIGAGILTSLLIHSLFTLTHHMGGRRVRTRLKRTAQGYQARAAASSSRRAEAGDAAWKDWDGYESASTQASPSSGANAPAKSAPVDDWETRSSDDWEDYESETPSTRSRREVDRPPPVANPEPTAPPRTRSSSSYSSRDADKARAGRTESVVDADYRVIVPPYQAREPDPREDAEDWFEDNEFETDEQRRRRAGL